MIFVMSSETLLCAYVLDNLPIIFSCLQNKLDVQRRKCPKTEFQIAIFSPLRYFLKRRVPTRYRVYQHIIKKETDKPLYLVPIKPHVSLLFFVRHSHFSPFNNCCETQLLLFRGFKSGGIS